MQCLFQTHASAAFLWKAGTWLHRSSHALESWLAARAKARDDAHALEAMSERELRDIGLDPGRINNAQWPRDWRV